MLVAAAAATSVTYATLMLIRRAVVALREYALHMSATLLHGYYMIIIIAATAIR